MKKNKFKRFNWEIDKLLVCQKCYETLTRADIAHFGKCPYCNHKIEMDFEVERYLLEPKIAQWLVQNITSEDLYDLGGWLER